MRQRLFIEQDMESIPPGQTMVLNMGEPVVGTEFTHRRNINGKECVLFFAVELFKDDSA